MTWLPLLHAKNLYSKSRDEYALEIIEASKTLEEIFDKTPEKTNELLFKFCAASIFYYGTACPHGTAGPGRRRVEYMKFVEAILQVGADLECYNDEPYKKIPLWYCIYRHDANFAEFLFDKGAQLNNVPSYSYSYLRMAICHDFNGCKMVTMLRKGANLTAEGDEFLFSTSGPTIHLKLLEILIEAGLKLNPHKFIKIIDTSGPWTNSFDVFSSNMTCNFLEYIFLKSCCSEEENEIIRMEIMRDDSDPGCCGQNEIDVIKFLLHNGFPAPAPQHLFFAMTERAFLTLAIFFKASIQLKKRIIWPWPNMHIPEMKSHFSYSELPIDVYHTDDYYDYPMLKNIRAFKMIVQRNRRFSINADHLLDWLNEILGEKREIQTLVDLAMDAVWHSLVPSESGSLEDSWNALPSSIPPPLKRKLRLVHLED